MDESEQKSLCLQFYNYLCEKMGTEELVLLRQKFYLLYDLLRLSRTEIIINSGSKSEGLELEGSDIDIMILQLDNTVLENENEAQCKNNQPNVFFMSTEDTKPGFTMLKLSKSSFIPYDSQVYYYWNTWRNNIVLSSEKAKQWMSSKWENSALVHGPCITDEDYESDIAFCLRCQIWIKQARKLREKSRLWPCPSVVEIIEKCGILFVPIGCKTSATEEFEWRISFSIAEKLLIYTFSHTQILCYALLKIMLKEIIETHSDSKGILCSYFLKTVVFWVSEEFQRDKWRPDMIIPCFMACLARLAYCVEHSNLPHYFIPEINLLEDKLVSHNTTDLKNLLNEFFRKGPNFLRYSKTLSQRAVLRLSSFNIINLFNTVYRYDKRCISGSHNSKSSCESCFNYLSSKISKLSFKRHNPLNMNVYIFRICQTIGSSIENTRLILLSNKDLYKNHKQRLPYLILALNADAIVGWLYLATYTFSLQHFPVCLRIVDYALSKCTPDKLYYFSDVLHYDQLDFTEQQTLKYGYLDISSIFRRHVIKAVCLEEYSILPLDIKDIFTKRQIFTKASLPPVVYAHYLRFLCFYRLNDCDNFRMSLQDIQLIIENEYFVCTFQKRSSYKLLATAYLKIGDRNGANKWFAVADSVKVKRHLCEFCKKYCRKL